MAKNLANLLSQLQEDETKYYLLKGRKLVTEDNFTILQNDNNSTQIDIIMPVTIGRKKLDDTLNYYIDYIDGAGKPGVVSNKTELKKIYNVSNNYEEVNDFVFDEATGKITINTKSVYLSEIENNQFVLDNNMYIIETNNQYSIDGRTYVSKVINENYEDSAEVSVDYPSKYADSIYFIKSSKNLTTAITASNISSDNDLINYAHMTWTLDTQVTNAAGEVNFSIRIEDNNGFKWQSEYSTFEVKTNLKENFYLKKEIEENFVIQNRTIKPVGNFKNVLVKGDTNSNKLFYKMNRYYQGQDMLAPKTYDNYNVYKTDKSIFYYKNTTKQDCILAKTYTINEILLYDNSNVWKYDSLNNKLIVQDKEYTNLSLVYTTNKAGTDIYYLLKYTYANKKYVVKLDSLTTSIYFGTDTDYSLFNITIRALATNFLTNINQTVISTQKPYVDAGEAAFITQISDKINLYSKRYDIPVYNRLIRFTFMSPNKDYGDWNNGEIEYVNSQEDYFIFSWTPDARATRSEGELSYYIEFFINGTYEEILENGELITAQNKAYSWSTLPTTITIENNQAATAKVDYIPHWVSYIENDLQDDMDSFMHGELQSQYETLEENILHTLLGDYSYITATEANNGYYAELNNISYDIILSKSSHAKQKIYLATITSLNPNFTNTISLQELNHDSIYGAAAQVGLRDFTIINITYKEKNVSFDIGSNIITITTEEGTKYTANYPLIAVNTLEFTATTDENNTIICDLEYESNLLNNYFIVYNEILNSLRFYKLDNNEQITVPYLQYANERFQNFIKQSENTYNTQEEEFVAQKDKIETKFGLPQEDEELSVYTQVWDMFNSLGNKLQGLYDFSQGSSLKLLDENKLEIPIEEDSFKINEKNYYFKIVYGTDGKNKQNFINYQENKNDLFKINCYYMEDGLDESGKPKYKIASSYDSTKLYYSFIKESSSYQAVSFNMVVIDDDKNTSNNFTIEDKTYHFIYNTLIDIINNEIDNAKNDLKDYTDTEIAEEKEEYNTLKDTLASDLLTYEGVLQSEYNKALSQFYNTWNVAINTNVADLFSTQQKQIEQLINTENEHIGYSINASANTLIINDTNNL